jgi:hypothetical protein
VTVAVCFLKFVSTLPTPSTLFRIEPTLAAVPGQTQPGTVSFTVFSAAEAS